MSHHADRLVNVEVRVGSLACESHKRLSGFIDPVLADQPPGRLGSEVDTDDEGYWPHPLQGEGNAEAKLVVSRNHGPHHARGKQLSDDPAQIDIRGEIRSKIRGADLGGKGRSECLESTPRNSEKDLSSQQLGEALGEEDDEDKANDEEQGPDQRHSITNLFCDDANREKAQDLAHLCAHGQTRLPIGSDLVRPIAGGDAELALKRRVGVQLTKEDKIKPLHDDGS